MCPHCEHTLGWHDLLPVVSWLSLGGRCRYCKQNISYQYPAVELLTAGVFVLSGLFWPVGLESLTGLGAVNFGLWLVLVVGFMALIVADVRWYILPDRITFPLMGVAAFLAGLKLFDAPSWAGVIQLAGSLVVSAGLFWVLYMVSTGKWIGYGDVKLGVVIGFVLGRIDMALLMLFVASALGSIVALPLMVTGKANRGTRLPFGPFLLTATILVYLFGASVVEWYNAQFIAL